MAVPVTDGSPVVAESDVIGLPCSENPVATIFRDVNGSWRLETAEGDLIALEHHQTFHAAGRSWRLSCASGVGSTSAAESPQTRSVCLRFCVSRDEEHVALTAVLDNRNVDLGSRTHNYLLLILARARVEDARQGLSEAASGWTYQEDLLTALRTTQSQLNIDVFRIRQHFARAGLQDFVNIVERRPRSKQLRIGVERLQLDVV